MININQNPKQSLYNLMIIFHLIFYEIKSEFSNQEIIGNESSTCTIDILKDS